MKAREREKIREAKQFFHMFFIQIFNTFFIFFSFDWSMMVYCSVKKKRWSNVGWMTSWSTYTYCLCSILNVAVVYMSNTLSECFGSVFCLYICVSHRVDKGKKKFKCYSQKAKKWNEKNLSERFFYFQPYCHINYNLIRTWLVWNFSFLSLSIIIGIFSVLCKFQSKITHSGTDKGQIFMKQVHCLVWIEEEREKKSSKVNWIWIELNFFLLLKTSLIEFIHREYCCLKVRNFFFLLIYSIWKCKNEWKKYSWNIQVEKRVCLCVPGSSLSLPGSQFFFAGLLMLLIQSLSWRIQILSFFWNLQFWIPFLIKNLSCIPGWLVISGRY